MSDTIESLRARLDEATRILQLQAKASDHLKTCKMCLSNPWGFTCNDMHAMTDDLEQSHRNFLANVPPATVATPEQDLAAYEKWYTENGLNSRMGPFQLWQGALRYARVEER